MGNQEKQKLKSNGAEMVDTGSWSTVTFITSNKCIKEAVARRYKVKVSDLEGKSRKKAYAIPRQVAMALSYRKLRRFGYSLPLIGKHFGDRDHTTVLFAYRKIGTKGQERLGQRTSRTISRPRFADRRA